MPGLRLLDIENVDIDEIHATIALFYQDQAKDLFAALSEIGEW
jgi:hypothetical protein